MKKLFLILFIFVTLPCFVKAELQAEETKPIEAGVSFDWISKTQMQRDTNILEVQKIVFDGITMSYPQKEFKAKYSQFFKDENHMKNFEEISEGKTEDENAYYCAFKMGNTSVMIMYAIQYKKDLSHIYYYDALGKLWFIDVFSENYPKFPYESYQYDMKGKLVAGYHYNSSYDQYAYDEKKKFKGRWYKENYYNRKAKVIMTRTNW